MQWVNHARLEGGGGGEEVEEVKRRKIKEVEGVEDELEDACG